MCHSEKSFQNMHLGTAHRLFPTHKDLIWGCLMHFETTPFMVKTNLQQNMRWCLRACRKHQKPES